ncbi:hypothetical protein ACNSPD_17780 [Yersinia enterocolitica]
MSTMTQIDYAKHAGVDRKTVSRWITAVRVFSVVNMLPGAVI